jgi:hypothetical protein
MDRTRKIRIWILILGLLLLIAGPIILIIFCCSSSKKQQHQQDQVNTNSREYFSPIRLEESIELNPAYPKHKQKNHTKKTILRKKESTGVKLKHVSFSPVAKYRVIPGRDK